MTTVKITIGSSMSGGQAGKYQFVSYGELKERGGTYYARYNESEATGMQGTRTILKWKEDSLIIMRNGTYEHRQEHQVGLFYQSQYKTPYLTLPLSTDTKELKIKRQPKGWTMFVKYNLALEGKPQGSVELDIRIEEEESSGH